MPMSRDAIHYMNEWAELVTYKLIVVIIDERTGFAFAEPIWPQGGLCFLCLSLSHFLDRVGCARSGSLESFRLHVGSSVAQEQTVGLSSSRRFCLNLVVSYYCQRR